jgi:predicted MFS family arabinose efflux permease
LFHSAIGAYAFAAVEDARRTHQCVEAGVCREVNPVLGRIADRFGIKTAMATKLALQAGTVATLVALRPDNRKRTTIAIVALTAIQIAVNAQNYRTLQRAKD